MKITIKQLTLENFKGIRSLTVEFDNSTTISGDNGTGKTTIFDAFTWLLFGKNSRDEKDFGIKTIENGVVTPQIDHSVEGVLLIDGVENMIRRTYSEKWTRRRGSEETEMTGHETTYSWNGVPQKAGEFAAKVNEIINESMFKVLTNATYFNTMPWQDRRKVLVEMAGTITAGDAMAGIDPKHTNIIKEMYQQGKNVADYKKEIAALKKNLKDQIDAIAPRIDEVNRSMPEVLDYEALKKSVYDNQVALLEVENTITSQVDAYKVETEKQTAVHRQIGELKQQIQQIEFEQKAGDVSAANDRLMQLNSLKNELKRLEAQLKSFESDLETRKKSVEEATVKVSQLREQYNAVAATTLEFKDGEFICPACKRDLDPDTINTRKEIMLSDFETNKAAQLAGIRKKGIEYKEFIDGSQSFLAEVTTDIYGAKQAIEEIKDGIAELEKPVQNKPAAEDPRIAPIRQQIATLELSMLEAPKLDIEGLKVQKGSIQLEIDTAKRQLATEDQIKTAKARIKELKAQEKDLAQQLADCEKKDFALAEYSASMMRTVEARVNEKFSIVRWRMFDTQINGGTVEVCEAMVNGVSYSDVNRAGKIQAGIDCINALSEHYGCRLPVWIDNRESVNVIPETKSQVINLVVSKDSQLVIK